MSDLPDLHILEAICRETTTGLISLDQGVIQWVNPAAERIMQDCGIELPLKGQRFDDLMEGRECRSCEIRRLDSPEVVFLRDVSRFRNVEDQLRSTLESIPFDFWMNDVNDRTILQNPVSRALWGDQTGHHSTEVTGNESINRVWAESNRFAFNGGTWEDEITYRIDGKDRVFRNVVAPVKAGEKTIGILGLNIEITDLKMALQERDDLLKELHHLVRNNLQIVMSSLNIYVHSPELSVDEAVRKTEQHVHALSLVHDQLYQSEDHRQVHLAHLLRTMAPGLTVDEQSDPVTVVVQQAIPLSILLQEIVSSSGDAGQLSGAVTIQETPTHLRLTFRGIPGPKEQSSTPGILEELLRQIRGSLTHHPGDSGTLVLEFDRDRR